MPSSTSANPANIKPTLASSDAQLDHNLQPPTKKPKREIKLDKLKTEQKSEAGNLKKIIEQILELIEDKGVANGASLNIYILACNEILAGVELDEVALRLFEMSFTDRFKLEDVLLKNLGPCMFPLFPCRTRGITDEYRSGEGCSQQPALFYKQTAF